MGMAAALEAISGARELYDWFGHWPGFHDSEVLSVQINLTGTSHLRTHTWETTNQVDERGYYIQTKHVVVEFILADISRLDLVGFSGQDIIFGLDIQKVESGFKLTIDPCINLGGEIVAGSVAIRLLPDEPVFGG
jgi:hypothetical protein